ncbi:MAG: hypothetical protein EBS21_05290 [Sphingomonadaceae bacterium]|nr:hypothetical protein [Sphingomonadaceae bacterium]
MPCLWRGWARAQLKIVGLLHFRSKSRDYGAGDRGVLGPDAASFGDECTSRPPSDQRRLALDIGN